jgi:hypothetical protein
MPVNVWDDIKLIPIAVTPRGSPKFLHQKEVNILIKEWFPIFVNMMMEAICSPKTSDLMRATRNNIAQDAFFIFTTVNTSNLTF